MGLAICSRRVAGAEEIRFDYLDADYSPRTLEIKDENDTDTKNAESTNEPEVLSSYVSLVDANGIPNEALPGTKKENHCTCSKTLVVDQKENDGSIITVPSKPKSSKMYKITLTIPVETEEPVKTAAANKQEIPLFVRQRFRQQKPALVREVQQEEKITWDEVRPLGLEEIEKTVNTEEVATKQEKSEPAREVKTQKKDSIIKPDQSESFIDSWEEVDAHRKDKTKNKATAEESKKLEQKQSKQRRTKRDVKGKQSKAKGSTKSKQGERKSKGKYRK